MSKREPVAEIGAEDYRIVRHTHDVELAEKLMRSELLKEYGCSASWRSFQDQHTCTDECLASVDLGRPLPMWIRITPCLPNSYGAAEGWAFTYQHAEPHSRGAFRAVVFYP